MYIILHIYLVFYRHVVFENIKALTSWSMTCVTIVHISTNIAHVPANWQNC